METGQDFRVDISLKLGAVSETIEVEATAPLLNADNSNIGGVVEQRKIVELPLNGRNYLQLAVLQPNVLPAVQGSANASRSGLNIAGASEVSNLYVKDGIDNNSASDWASHTPILDTVREFKVMTGTYSAEYGRASGAQVMVTTKSGGNDLHGSMWELHRNSAFDAREFSGPSMHRSGGTSSARWPAGDYGVTRRFSSWAMKGSCAGGRIPAGRRCRTRHYGAEISAG